MSYDGSWAEYHRDRVSEGAYPRWPNETMIKTIFGSRLEDPPAVDETTHVLDVGTGFGNNLLPFLDAGCECAGVEIDPEIVEITEEVISDRGYDADIRRGENQDLPFPDDTFDILLSINVLHYEGEKSGIKNGLAEYARVMKPSGYLFLMTTGPRHEIYQRAKSLDNHKYVLQESGFRNGEQMFYFDTEKYLELYLADFFERTETGRETVTLGDATEDYLIGVGETPQ
jgi:SAM-dependent methyltransferase